MAAELSGNDDKIELLHGYPRFPEQNGEAGKDRSLCQLYLTDILLREISGVSERTAFLREPSGIKSLGSGWSSHDTKAPVFLIYPPFISSRTEAKIPLPQRPEGGASPMVFNMTVRSIRTSSTAPSAARIPQLMFIPSRAGPAAQEHPRIRPPCVRRISPFVPISIKRTVLVSSNRRQAVAPAVISPPR